MVQRCLMRTTLDIADDVLAAAKAIAKEQGKTAGAVASELARAGLRKPIRFGSRNGALVLKVKNPAARVVSQFEFRFWAESGPTRVASGRTGVWAKAGIPVRTRNRAYRP